MNLFARKSIDIDQSLIDPWSGIHCGTGIIMGILDFKKEYVLLLAMFWELLENSDYGHILWKYIGDSTYKGDSFSNMISDIIFIFICSYCHKYFKIKSNALFLAFSFIYFKIYELKIKEWDDNLSCCICNNGRL